jgi:hypothetical protein
MRKTLKVKSEKCGLGLCPSGAPFQDIERWILAELAESPLSYYDLLRRCLFMPNDLDTCLNHLVGAGEILRPKSTPNPTFSLPNG